MNIEEVWPEYRTRLRAFLHARVSNPADVDDLLQEISIKVFSGLPQLKDPSKLQAWLFQTANRAIIDHYRTSARGRDVHPDDLWYAADDPGVRQELAACVEPFLNALPAETARMLTAIDIEGMSQTDYAKANGLSYSTLKTRVQKGRAALRDSFQDCCTLTIDARGDIADYDPKSDNCKKC